MNMKFNVQSEKQEYIYRPNEAKKRSYQISKFDPDKGEYALVGEYKVSDTTEDEKLTKKKLDNLIKILNGKEDLEQLGNLTKKRILFTIMPETDDSDPIKIIFRDFDGSRVSEENAVLTIEKGVLDVDKYLT